MVWWRLGNESDVESLITAAVVLGGGFWGAYQFILRRATESALDLGVDTCSHSLGHGQTLVAFRITLKNIGARRIAAARALSDLDKADYQHSVVYPGDLQIARILPEAFPAAVTWWSDDRPLPTVNGLPPHISLLDEYSNAERDIDFFIEPGESYVFEPVCIVSPGHYLAKVVFIGSRGAAAEYWSRVVHVRADAVDAAALDVPRHPPIELPND